MDGPKAYPNLRNWGWSGFGTAPFGQGQAMATTGRIVGPTIGGLLMQHWFPSAPFLLAGAMMLLSLAMFGTFRRILVPSTDRDRG